MRRNGNWSPERLWRLPAALSTLALVTLLAWPFLDRFASAAALAAGAWSVLVALAWWWVVFGPLLGHSGRR
jgi:hypothetical protein